MDTVEILYDTYLRSRKVTTDSRGVEPGCIFFALKGERFDGGAFVEQALAGGAALCVTSWREYEGRERCLVVPDVAEALRTLAVRHRASLGISVLGITGTNGKTTTKELVRAVLSRRYRTSATRGNLNNHLGVPLTLLSIPADAEVAIVEMGANHPGEIADLCRVASPGFGLITNVGRAHLEGFGSFEGVVATKTELYRHLAHGGTAFVCADNSLLVDEAAKCAPGMTVVTYGSSTASQVRGSHVADVPFMRFYFEVADCVYTVQSRLLGGYNFQNCMAAVCVGLRFGVDPFDIKEAIEAYEPSNQRSQLKATGRNRLYLDCYNANPSSMEAAVASFAAQEWPRKAAVIGGMHELGADERAEHMRLVDMLAGCGLERCLLVGPEFDGLALPAGMTRCADTAEAAAVLRREPIEGALVLVKGSNTNRLWTLEELL
ncbi:MAG: UDP-N-acetylmuramoyl-tripeptide--D-alanyl-D-alanine ligase [Bacteroidales bacterium]|nr:UDP-N-acetylmuramoyl-tripeptide--D-alanyl-D-alanine ligase [Bacteroidales bacterium]